MLESLLRDRLRKFMSLLLKVLAEDADDAVHDLRVWSRRLQQVVAALSSNRSHPKPGRSYALYDARGNHLGNGGTAMCY